MATEDTIPYEFQPRKKVVSKACKLICSFLDKCMQIFMYMHFGWSSLKAMIRQHPGGSRKYDNDYLKQVLAENSTQTQK